MNIITIIYLLYYKWSTTYFKLIKTITLKWSVIEESKIYEWIIYAWSISIWLSLIVTLLMYEWKPKTTKIFK